MSHSAASSVILCGDLEVERCLEFPDNSKNLLTFIEHRSGHSANILRKLIDCAGDTNLENYGSHLTSEFIDHFNGEIVAKISQSAKTVQELFPDLQIPTLVSGQSREISLTRRQVLCLLSRMFLCVVPTEQAVGLKTDETPLGVRLNFAVWLNGPSASEVLRPDDPRLAYMFTLVHYFSRAVRMSEAEAQETLRFGRICLTDKLDWQDLSTEIRVKQVCSVSLEDRIGEHPGHEVEVDFANRNIGFHKTATQEEILFGLSPEMCVATLIADTLEANESFYITGAWKISSSQGYGTRLTASLWDGHPGPHERWVTCIDAVDLWEAVAYEKTPFTEIDLVNYQIKTAQLLRGLEKLRAGFIKCPRDLAISTGKWGCGAFGGHPLVLILLQVMAAAECGTQLKLCLFGDEKLRTALSDVFEIVDGKTIGDVYQMLVLNESRLSNLMAKVLVKSNLSELQKYIIEYDV